MTKALSIYLACLIAVVPVAFATQSANSSVVCYISSLFLSNAHDDRGLYPLEAVDTDLCTHIIFGAGIIDKENHQIKFHDTWADFDERFDDRIAAFKRRGIKVMLAVGSFSIGDRQKFQNLVSNQYSRKHFVEHAVSFLAKHNFDGLELDWMFPACNGYTRDQDPNEKEYFKLLVEELSRALKPRNLLLSAVVGDIEHVIRASYDVPHLSMHMDWITARTIEYNTAGLKMTGNTFYVYRQNAKNIHIDHRFCLNS